MKRIKFWQNLVESILNGKKTVTWRLFDDKNLTVGDELAFVVTETGEQFAGAVILQVKEKELGKLEGDDFDGHEKYENSEDLLQSYRGYYGDRVTLETVVKIIRFELL